MSSATERILKRSQKLGASAAETAPESIPAEPTAAQIAKEAKERTRRAKEADIAPPIEVFPAEIVAMIEDQQRVYGSPLDFYVGGILAAASIAIGNRFGAAYKTDNTHPANLYIVLVGTSGIGKTPTLKAMLSPIHDIEDAMQTEFVAMKQRHQQICSEYRGDKKSEAELPPPPKPPEILLQDAMLPSIQISLAKNKHGLLCWWDEIRGWISNLKGRHQTGDETSFWLSTFDTSFAKVTRQSREGVYLKNPFITVVGGIQPGPLREMASTSHVDSGMFNRFCFCYPPSMDKAPDNNNDTDPNLLGFYRRVIRAIYDLPSHFDRPTAASYDPEGLTDAEEDTGERANQRINLWLTDAARATYAAWKEDNRLRRNRHAADDERLASLFDKQESFVLRFALILEMLELGTGLVKEAIEADKKDFDPFDTAGDVDTEKLTISAQSVEGGIILSKYFESTAMRVLDRFDSPVNAMPMPLRNLYKMLPDEFKTINAVEYGNAMDISTRTVERMLNGQFGVVVKRNELKQGFYRKLYL